MQLTYEQIPWIPHTDETEALIPAPPPDKRWPANGFLDDHRLLSDGKDNLKAFVTFEEAAASRRGFGTAPARGVFDDAIDLSVAEVDEGQLESHDADEGLGADLTIGGDPREHQACPVCDGNVEWGECDYKKCHYEAKPNLNHLRKFLFAEGKVTPKAAQPKGADYTRCLTFNFRGKDVPGCGTSTFKKDGRGELICVNCDRPVMCAVCRHPVAVGKSDKLKCHPCSVAFKSDTGKIKHWCPCGGEMRGFSSSLSSTHAGRGEMLDRGIKYCVDCGANTYVDRRVQTPQRDLKMVEERLIEVLKVGREISQLAKQYPQSARAAVLKHVEGYTYKDIAEIACEEGWPDDFRHYNGIKSAIKGFDKKIERKLSVMVP